MFTSKRNVKVIAGMILSVLVVPLAGHAYSSGSEIREFLSKNDCRIVAVNSSDDSLKYKRNLNREIKTENSSVFVKNARIEDSNDNQYHIFVPAPSHEVGVSWKDLGVDEEFYIYFDLNKNANTSDKTLVSDVSIYTDNTFTRGPAKLENFATNQPFSLKFKTQMNTDRYYFLQCFPKK